jgi:carbon monoxide dehydrogenase subunit G
MLDATEITGMVNINCKNHILEHQPEDVFRAGTLVENLPSRVKGFVLGVAGEQLKLGDAVSFEVTIPILGQKEEVTAEVTEFHEGERVVIFGGNENVGDTSLWIDLSDHRNGGTHISYGLDIEYGRKIRKLQRPLATAFLGTIMSQYARVYTNNIETYLEEQSLITSRGKNLAA